MTDSNVPVLVGIAQVAQKTKDLAVAKEPLDLMLDALRNAISDTGNPTIRGQIGAIRVSQGQWQYQDPARYLAEKLELNGIETGKTVFGGNGVQTTINLSALDIQAGRFDAIAIAGAECGYSQAQARKTQTQLEWRDTPGTPAWTIKSGIGGRDPVETARGIGGASQMYAVIENALRFERGETLREHLAGISNLWSRFNDVAQSNPNAWIQAAVSAETIRTSSPSNRPIAFPYPKLMNANNNVDQGAALLMCSVGLAKRLNIPRDKWIFPWAGTDAHDTSAVSHRASLTHAPGLQTAASRLLELTNLSLDDIDHFDLYSCFPSAVQVAAKEIGLNLERPLTVTGGLTFGGGPLNNYVMHAIARSVELLREQPTAMGMVTANGGYLTKHAHGIYSNTEPPKPFVHEDVQPLVDTSNDRETDENPQEAVTIEGYTVMHGRDSAVRGIAAGLTREGKRTWGVTTDPELLEFMQTHEFCGEQVKIAEDGTMTPKSSFFN